MTISYEFIPDAKFENMLTQAMEIIFKELEVMDSKTIGSIKNVNEDYGNA